MPEKKEIHHEIFNWSLIDVYFYDKLLNSHVDGPEFYYGTEHVGWVLQLGQTRKPAADGISLFLKRNDNSQEVTANMRVTVREKLSARRMPIEVDWSHVDSEPLLDVECRKEFFPAGRCWESPVFVTNEEFKTVFLKNGLYSSAWEISVALMYIEIVEMHPPLAVLHKKMIGEDLSKFCGNETFSDIVVRGASGCSMKAHKAILHARCGYFAKFFAGETECRLRRPPNPEELKCVMSYMYTGDLQSIQKTHPLPFEIQELVEDMPIGELGYLTIPNKYGGTTRTFGTQSFTIRWSIFEVVAGLKHSNFAVADNLCIMPYDEDNVANKERFSLTLNVNDFGGSRYVSASLKLERGRSTYVFVRLSKPHVLKSSGTRRAGRLAPGESIEMLNIIALEKLLDPRSFLDFPDDLNIHIKHSAADFVTEFDKTDVKADVKFLDSDTGESLNHEALPIYHDYAILSKEMKVLLETPTHSDCTIRVGSERFSAHKVILAARSPYFAKVFAEEPTGACSSESEVDIEKDVEINASQMKIILEEIYTGSANMSNSEAREMYTLAKFFDLPSLKTKCELQHTFE